MRQTNDVADLLDGKAGEIEVLELPCAIQCCGVKNHMIMDVRLIYVCRHYESVIPFGEAHCQFIAYLISLLRVISPGLKDCRII
jgi:hypothetical protein